MSRAANRGQAGHLGRLAARHVDRATKKLADLALTFVEWKSPLQVRAEDARVTAL